MSEPLRLNFLDVVDSIMFQGYKSYQGLSTERHCLERLQNVNVLMGKNNSGKSSVIELLEACFKTYKRTPVTHFEIRASKSENVLPQLQRDEFSRIGLRYDRSLHRITKDLREYDNFALIDVDLSVLFDQGSEHYKHCSFRPKQEIYANEERWRQDYAKSIGNGLKKFRLFRLAADRDIRPEVESDVENLESNGEGATNLVRRLLLHEKHDAGAFKNKFLAALNEIIGNDGKFADIQVLQLEAKEGESHLWEVFLEEVSRPGRFPLSACGSGLKTIILMLLNLLAFPSIEQKRRGNFTPCFAFEELENNLHPAVQRRLFQFVYEHSLKTGEVVFITTHSNVAINAFYGQESVAFYQITRDESGSHISRVSDTPTVLDAMQDLGVRAADILQTNGVIWVEGPSDQVYIERWLQIYQETEKVDRRIRKGFDYQYLQYGGACLPHYSGDIECQTQDLIQVFRINRNAVIVMDSDIRTSDDEINEHKKRIVDEFQTASSFAWVTAGKEIENYVDSKLWEQKLGTSEPLGQYDCFPDYCKQAPKHKSAKKVNLAREIVEQINADNWEQYDLKEKIAEIYARICQWNA